MTHKNHRYQELRVGYLPAPSCSGNIIGKTSKTRMWRPIGPTEVLEILVLVLIGSSTTG
jgi:hypothetical protein